jgi:hypothetical protein
MAEEARCVHGASPLWCPRCSDSEVLAATASGPKSSLGEYGFHGGETKQEVIDDICQLLQIPQVILRKGGGSSLPSEVFKAAAVRVGVRYSSMPAACEAIVRRAGMHWEPGYDSRGSRSGGGSTVTLEGIRAMRAALGRLL